jgi:hypothetical protein
MTAARKMKVSLTLSADLLALVDRDAARRRETRSGVVESWLRRAATGAAEKEIEQATEAYYLSLRGPAIEEDEKLSRALAAAARRVSYDEPAKTAPRRRRRR